jgi:hypothetical protein
VACSAFHTKFERSALPAPRVLRTSSSECPSGSSFAIATKLYWPPTPLTTLPSGRVSELAAPSRLTVMVVLMKRAWRRCSRSISSLPYNWLMRVTLRMSISSRSASGKSRSH